MQPSGNRPKRATFGVRRGPEWYSGPASGIWRQRSMQSEVESTLTKVPLFKQLGRAYVLDIAHNADLRDYAPGEKIVTQGDEPEHFFVIINGEVNVFKEKDGAAGPVVA